MFYYGGVIYHTNVFQTWIMTIIWPKNLLKVWPIFQTSLNGTKPGNKH